MKLGRLRIQSLPGIPGGFELAKPGPGLNVVLGPNASGKTSTCRALRALLWPEDADLRSLSLVADFETSRGSLCGRIQDREVSWEQDGRRTPGPPLPPGHLSGCWFLGLEVLLPDREADRDLGRRIRKEMAGGFDVQALLQGEAFAHRPRKGKSQAGELADRERELREILRQHQELEEKARGLGELRREKAEAEQAGAEIEALNKARALLEARREREAAKAELRSFPPAQARLRNDLEDRLEELEEEIAGLEREIQAEEQEREREGKECADLRIPDPDPDPEVFLERPVLLGDFRRLESRLEALGREIRSKELEARDACGYLGEGLDPSEVRIGRRQLQEVEGFLEERDRWRARKAALEARIGLFHGGARRPFPWWRRAALLLLVLALGFSLLPAFLLHWGYAFLALLPLLVFFLATGGEEGKEAGRAERELRRGEEDMARLARELEEGLGFSLEGSPLSLALFARHLEAAQRAASDLEGLTEERDRLEKEIGAQLEEWRGFLLPWEEEAPDGRGLQASYERIHQRWTRRGELRKSLEDREEKLRRARQDRAKREGKIRDLFRSLDLEPGDRAGLWALLRNHEAFEEAEKRRTEAEWKCNQIEVDLAGRPELMELGEAGLARRLEEAKELASRKDEILEKMVRIERDVEEANTGERLQAARALRETARNQLEDCLAEVLFAEAGRFLLGLVQEEQERTGRPELLEKAARCFAEFTKDRYRLEVGNEGGELVFRAREQGGETDGELRALETLSSATRVQLLLAVRLAFAQQAEAGEALPFFLDEALTNADPERYEAVVGVFSDLASREGRQVFYLTSQPWDAGAWGAGRGEVVLLDLGKARGEASRPPGAFVVPERVEIPPPGSCSPSEYATLLGVPVLDGLAGPGSLHLFYLLSDRLPLLHRLLQAGYRHLGSLKSLLHRALPPRLLQPAEEGLCRTRIRLGEALLQAWAVGRGRRADGETLREARVSGTFRKGLSEILEEKGGDAGALMEVLEERSDPRVKGYRRDKREELRDFLTERGHLATLAPLGEEAIRTRVLEALREDLERDPLCLDELNDRISLLLGWVES